MWLMTAEYQTTDGKVQSTPLPTAEYRITDFRVPDYWLQSTRLLTTKYVITDLLDLLQISFH